MNTILAAFIELFLNKFLPIVVKKILEELDKAQRSNKLKD